MADEGATTTSGKAAAGLSMTGPASALSNLVDKISGGLSGIGSIFKPLPNVKLPIANPLLAYASYDYVLSIGVLTDQQLASPDTTYMKGQKIQLVCKSANMEPANRVQTAFGKFDFIIDKVDIKSQIGLEKGSNTNMLSMDISIIEPYSMGMFLIALQQAAWNAGHNNYLMAPYLLTIEFKGSTETGTMSSVPNTIRRIPFMFRTAQMNVTEKGSIYQCTAYPTNAPAFGGNHAVLKTDVSIAGKTVQEVLQTGEKSLQVALNKRLQKLKTDKLVDEPDEILILFPKNIGTAPVGNSNPKPPGAAKTDSPNYLAELEKQLGVTRKQIDATSKDTTLMQLATTCNSLGAAELGFSSQRAGDTPFGKDDKIWDPTRKVFIRGNNIVDPKSGEFRFVQGSDVMNAINQVLLTSDYARKTLSEVQLSPEGFRKWWRIEAQVFNKSGTESLATGTKPKLVVFRVVEYDVHASRLLPPNEKGPGFDLLKKQAVKQYNYTYTGKNTDIISFNLDFKIGFAAVMGAAKLSRTQDAQLTASQSDNKPAGQTDKKPLKAGKLPEKTPGAQPTIVRYVGLDTNTDRHGGSGVDTEDTRAAKLFHDAITASSEMLKLDMKIIGDPYYIAQSGQGNYTSIPSDKANLNADGTINYQSGEVDIIVNFRTPIDLNQTTGLYDFGNAKTAPVIQWSGLYQVISVNSTFSNGQFIQVINGRRRPTQELKAPASKDKVLSTSWTPPPGTPNDGWGEG